MKNFAFRLSLVAVAAAAWATAADAATVITTTGDEPFSQGYFASPANFYNPPSWAAKDRNGSLYITGLGTGVSSNPGNSYTENVQFQGSGNFGLFNGIGTYSVKRDGQDPRIHLLNTTGDYSLDIDFRHPTNRTDVNSDVYAHVFSDNRAPGDRNIDAADWDSITATITKISTGESYSFSSADYYDEPGYFFTMTSNTAVVAPAVTSPVPEPATWAMMIVGFGLIGATSRYRRRSTTASIA